MGLLSSLHILPSGKRPISILHDVSGIIKPCRMTLLLGPHGSGKTTLLRALARKLDSALKDRKCEAVMVEHQRRIQEAMAAKAAIPDELEVKAMKAMGAMEEGDAIFGSGAEVNLDSQNANEESKANATYMKAIKQRMEKDIDEVGKLARQAKSKVEELNRDMVQQGAYSQGMNYMQPQEGATFLRKEFFCCGCGFGQISKSFVLFDPLMKFASSWWA